MRIIAAAFQLFPICGTLNIFQEEEHAVGHFTCRLQHVWVSLLVTSYEICKLSCRIQDLRTIYQKPFSLKINCSLFEEHFCMFFCSLNDFEGITFIINPSDSKGLRFSLQMSPNWYQFLCKCSPTWAFSSLKLVSWVLCSLPLFKGRWVLLSSTLNSVFQRCFTLLNWTVFLILWCEKSYRSKLEHETLQHPQSCI